VSHSSVNRCNSLQSIAGTITSTGPLGDVNIQSTSGINNITAPSIFDNIISTGPIEGMIQTTGERTDPVTGAVSQVSADLGRIYLVPATGRNGAAYATSTIIDGGGTFSFTGEIISRGNLLSTVRSDGGGAGTIAVAGDLGALTAINPKAKTRVGGVLINGVYSGQIVVMGSAIGDMTFNGDLFSSGIAVEGRISAVAAARDSISIGTTTGIVGNLTVERRLDNNQGVILGNSSIISGGVIGDLDFGTSITVQDGNQGIVAAIGSILTPPTGPGHVYANAGVNPNGSNAAAIDAIFTNGGVPLSLDITGENLDGLALILADLVFLSVGPDGNLTGPKK
jgi:hypothetical protein